MKHCDVINAYRSFATTPRLGKQPKALIYFITNYINLILSRNNLKDTKSGCSTKFELNLDRKT